MRYVFNIIASIGRQIDVYRPMKIQKPNQPTVFLMQLQHNGQWMQEKIYFNLKHFMGTPIGKASNGMKINL